MTLVEVMVAVTIFVFIVVSISVMLTTSSRITVDNTDQVRMSEVARTEAERIKELFKENSNIENPPITFISNLDKENTVIPDNFLTGKYYGILYNFSGDPNGNYLLKITVGPDVNNHLDPTNVNNYVLVTWLPKTGSGS